MKTKTHRTRVLTGVLHKLKLTYRVLRSAQLLTGALAKTLPELIRIWSDVEEDHNVVPMIEEVVSDGT